MSEPSIVDTPAQAAALELPPLLVREPLAAFLDARGLGSGPLDASPIGDGHSNVTYLIRRDGAELVLRRPPRGPLPPSAHDVLREAQLLEAIAPTAARTPAVLATCAEEAVIGAPFYVMAKVEGDVLVHEVPAALDPPTQRARVGEQLVDALAEVHAVDWRACGLEGYGKPTGYLERQLRRFGGLWEHNRTRELPTLTRVSEWLAAHRPESGPATIVHGDYRLGNVMFEPAAPARLAAIFDWELATIGDPLADVGYLTATWAQPGDEDAGTVFALGAVTMQPGFPAREQLIARYEEVAGRSMRDVRWYQALALWKAAIFLEGSYRRLLAGTTDDPFFALLDTGVPKLAERAWDVARGASE
ncbi:phosphotransferase family protein [Conexibacter stalactiti]|uniref:Phosphotransferase family protein n=1 Tax=Conexibacter stalactiti TaxID=1940611 RepID=A0ABU4HM26_9ACTN|nr:phosphotransferase family protein [Conexibacter stalactiti]MDW5593774.1 phosphotransferase family protein [Conexibacter stalactiti]MEC5034416.1 phosphotransferase family protein [Conexibacter stalactiti]